ncbi:GH36-type glycosyl hydrolase domain-containing protein [uncultured Sphaerochaeta sp.]|uniref:GH36-type glycosyl hydrolase domain-containing protein n=1 Tax=uncultured Sphaerochaeta sp. TaxID=886478 RepID=UPI002A0A6E2B|nr:glucoamylase family protein [uncultured Sphaerochaeta sp.]
MLPLFKTRKLRFFRQRYETEDPLHSELFSPEQMQNYGKILAQEHIVSNSWLHKDRLLKRLEENEAVLEDVRNLLTETVTKDRRIVPAGDWLLDNFYLIENIICTTRRDLPVNYSRELPRLQSSTPVGLPRVYAIAIERISHGDGHVDAETLPEFINAYQSVSRLKLGELWAVPIMLRLALIENLRRIAIRISKATYAKNQATTWAERIVTLAKTDPKSLFILVADMARSKPVLNSSYVAELSQKLYGKGALFALPLTWIEQQLAEKGLNIESLVQSEMQQQAADQVSISNTIGSLRSLDAIDWKEFVESTSYVEEVLRKDPSTHYAKMDFSTRDTYRHAVEKLAKHSGLEEQHIALLAVQLAQEHKQDIGNDRRLSHVGYYLLDKGLPLLKKTIHKESKAYGISFTIGYRAKFIMYVGSIGILSACIAWLFLIMAQRGGLSGWELILISILAFIGAGSFSSIFVNWIVTLIIPSNPLPRMDYSDGIPSRSRTLVVVPAMLTSKRTIDLLVEALEVRFLANHDKNLFFGLLTDFLDANEETLISDTELIAYAQQKIQELNDLYRIPERDPFFLFHRGRKWNASEKKWIGYERKRGKLADLNALIREGKKEPFTLIIGSLSQLKSVKYIITLDTDTTLPRDSAKKLAGTMDHPLNRPQYNLKRNRIIAGHALLQPRVTASLSGVSRSAYSRLIGNNPGLDPYTCAVSDVYQDLFSQGSFIGKGIYNVEAFETVLKGRFPENSILSHDLLEGCYARSGLVSDIQLFEDVPITYRADVDRHQRWIRGDWQSFRWLLPFVPTKQKKMQKNVLSSLSKWKILDNLRRSITSLILMTLLVIGWITLTKPMVWTLLISGLIVFPPIFISFFAFFQKPYDMPLGSHLVSTIHSLSMQLSSVFLNLACLPHDAYFSVRAIVRTCWRMLFSHRHLLQWNPSENNKHDTYQTLFSSIRFMWIAPTLSVITFLLLLFLKSTTLLVASPLLLLWACSPVIAWKISKPTSSQEDILTEDQNAFLHRLSRKTWAFFETFVTAEENWLPPDNFQEIPVAKIAHRTSPTNMGLALLSNLGARDLGYISDGLLLERANLAIQSMESLETYRKHFYNWYDTITLQPLSPRYVSTVDSGNLVGHLLTLHSGLLTLSDEKFSKTRIWKGLEDTNMNLLSVLEKDVPSVVLTFQNGLASVLKNLPENLSDVWKELQNLHATAENICRALKERKDPMVKWWSNMLLQQCHDFLDELEFMLPWLPQAPLFEHEPEFQKVCEFSSQRELYVLESELLKTLGKRLPQFFELLTEGHDHAEKRFLLINKTALQIENFTHMDFTFLYNKHRNLFAIGYSVDSHRKDSGYYDLLASEARLTSFVAIAQEQVPKENWFSLGRLIAKSGSETMLFSWSGSMFEYLMPLLIMPSYKRTLLGQTCDAAVRRQIEYGYLLDIPWGISESGYSAYDASHNYRYHAFGVPGLGLKRELHNDIVIAPYATALSLLVAPKKACQNLLRLSNSGFEGAYGMYEAIDYTKSRLLEGQRYVLVQSFMAHHQGMSFLSFVSQLLDSPMQKRFESIPMIRATNLLLEEKSPRPTFLYSQAINIPEKRIIQKTSTIQSRLFSTYQTPIPEVHLISSDTYHVMVTNAGGGYSHWKKLALTRWHEDATRDNWGTFVYIRNEKTKEYWSNTFQPTLKNPEKYEVTFSEGRAEYKRRDNDFDTNTEIAVSPEDPIELRRLTITNRSSDKQIIDVTSYAEVVLTKADTDAAHPSFSNLFIQTEIVEKLQTILCSRRPRSPEEHYPCMFHLMMVHEAKVPAISYETDRMKFIGRGKTIVSPNAMQILGPLSGTQGSVLDPIVAIRQQIEIESETSVTIDIVTGIGETKEAALQLAEKYQGKWFTNRVFELSQTHCQLALKQINSTPKAALFYDQIAGSILYANTFLRSESSSIIANHRGQSGLWGYSISGDLPIVLFTIRDSGNIGMVKQLVQAHSYWHQKGLEVDFVILHEDFEGYRHELQEQILTMVTTVGEKNIVDQPGGIFIRALEQLSIEDHHLLEAVSRIVLDDSRGSLENQIIGQRSKKKPIQKLRTLRGIVKTYKPSIQDPPQKLQFFNGLGGFSSDGKEYDITVKKDRTTPAPWANVLANPNFGTILTESGTSYTWMGNAHEFRLTPWYNDPVSDTSGEALYIRDEESGQFWSPTSLPSQGNEPYICKHGFGYSTFEHSEFGIHSNLTVFVAHDASVKFMMLALRNDSDRNRKLSATNYTELVLGSLREKSAMHVVTEFQGETGAIFAQNWYNTDFAGTTVFLDATGSNHTITGDRTEFIGRNGTLANPEAMTKERLSGSTGPAYDPCAAIQVPFLLEKGKEVVVVFKLGAASNREEAKVLINRFKTLDSVQDALKEVCSYWQRTVSVIQIETPDVALNTLSNGWLVYQMLSSRLWGRSGFYQSGGAFGFRDQLQDVMALVYAEPTLARAQILLCAGQQFVEGDVQHWWHPPMGRGVRTHICDDYLWLPLATCRYISITGDTSILDEMVYFIEEPLLKIEEESSYDKPHQSKEVVSLYDHCVRSLLHSSHRGVHGLPLMGGGDWNDGMNLVGIEGKGESVWLGFFLYTVLMQFSELATMRDDHKFAALCGKEAYKLQQHLKENAWDGSWYNRAWFDDGWPLGSSQNTECKIDSLAQSWSVLSGAGEMNRSLQAMDSVSEFLVDREHGLIKLLDPPFDSSTMEPGYIKGYVPGVRENGGQYTHAAIWTAMAFARLGDTKRAWELCKMINPIEHASSPELIDTYQVDPYVMAADIYSCEPHAGRGGWTWYTGSASWMYRFILESLLGFNLVKDTLHLTPLLPSDWKDFKIHYRFHETMYHITVVQTAVGETKQVIVDGTRQQEDAVILLDDHKDHTIEWQNPRKEEKIE